MRSHECDICKKIFSRPSHVIRHKIDVHKVAVSSEEKNAPEKKYRCNVCEKTFSRPSHVRRHQENAHTQVQEKQINFAPKVFQARAMKLLPKKTPIEHKESPVKHNSHECELCEKSFSRPALLIRHKLQVHKIEAQESEIAPPKQHECSVCHKRFKYKSNSRKHERSVHGFIHSSTKKLKCSECKNFFYTVKEFINHFSLHHSNISIVTEELSFETDEEFIKWKTDVEKTTASSFVCARTYQTASSDFIKLFVCHRNGKFKSQGKGERYMKLRGTHKINYFCPSRIYHISKQNGEIKVRYISKHLGHKCEYECLKLSKDEKEEIACQLQIGVPMNRILLNISENVSKESRLSMTRMQDVRNIASSYNINSSEKRSINDVLSVDSWVKQMLNEENSPILLYKLPGEVKDEYPGLLEEDFVLAFMNEAQREIFQLYGETVVSVDSTHGTNMYDVQLTSIVVKDSNWEGFPVAFLWCNKQTELVFTLFFSAIKKRIEKLNCLTFMSDDFSAFYNAWKKVFGEVKYHLLCDWHVKRAWTKNLSSGPHKIVNLQKRKLVQEHLDLMINEVDIATFTRLLERKASLVDEETQSFWTYFENHYENRIPLWAHCYRTGALINTNMSLERWHKELKYNSDLKGKCGGRLDKAIHSLMKSLRLKLMDRFASISRGKLTKKVILIRKAHAIAFENYHTVSVWCIDDYWHVSSFSTVGETYKVKEVKLDSLHKCNLICDKCDKCLHQFVCNCPESAIKYNFCKHSHIVGLLLAKECTSEPNNSEDIMPLEMDIDERADCERSAIEKELRRMPQHSLQDEANDSVKRALEVIGKCSSDEQFKLIISSMNTLTSNLSSLENSHKYLKPVQKVVPNKNIAPQRTFPLKKKRRLQ